MTTTWQPFREPLSRTLLRTVAIAVVVGVLISRWGRAPGPWPLVVLMVFWFSFGGHWVEIGFLNGLRPRIPTARAVQFATRVSVWFIGGALLAIGATLTAQSLGELPPAWPGWWFGGIAFIAIELIAHLGLQLRGQSSVYNGRG